MYLYKGQRRPTFVADYPAISDFVISEPGILDFILKLDVKKSSARDRVPNEFLKCYANWVSKYLAIIFAKLVNEGQVPDDCVTAKVKPIHQSGEKYVVTNCRGLPACLFLFIFLFFFHTLLSYCVPLCHVAKVHNFFACIYTFPCLQTCKIHQMNPH